MAKDKKSFILYCDIIHTVRLLSEKQKSELFMLILAYVNDENPNNPDDPIVKIAFEPIKQTLKRDLLKYEAIRERNRINGLKGGRPQGAKLREPKKPTGLSGNPKNPGEPKKADSGIGIDSGIDSGIGIDSKNSTNVELAAMPQKPQYGNIEINKMLEALKGKIGIDDFADTQRWARIYAKNCFSLMGKIGKDEFVRRLDIILNDDFKRKNCNRIKFVYNEIKGFIEPKNNILIIET